MKTQWKDDLKGEWKTENEGRQSPESAEDACMAQTYGSICISPAKATFILYLLLSLLFPLSMERNICYNQVARRCAPTAPPVFNSANFFKEEFQR